MEAKSVDLQDKIERIRSAWNEAYPLPRDDPAPRPPNPEWDNVRWLVTVLDDGVVVEQKGKLSRVPYSIKNGKIVFAPESEWEPVQRGFVAVKSDDATKGIELYDNDLAALPGYAVKAAGEGWSTGYLVKFGGEGDLSQWRDVFDRDTDYGRATKSDVWVHHRMLPGVGKRRLTNQAEIGMDDEGVFIKHLLDLRNGYEAKLYGLVQQGKLGWSSGTAPHLVDRKSLGDGRHKIEQWPLGLDASYTPTPAGGLVVNAGAMKSLLEDSGIDLLNIIHEASIADDSVKSIDTDSQEASDVNSDRHDGAKAASERARALLLELDILALETAQ